MSSERPRGGGLTKREVSLTISPPFPPPLPTYGGEAFFSVSLRGLPKTAKLDPFFRYLPAYSVEMGGSDARMKFDHPAAVVARKMDNCVVAVRLGKALSIQ